MGPNKKKLMKKKKSKSSFSGIGRFRSDRGQIEGVKTDLGRARGGPLGTKNGELWAKHDQLFSKIFGHHPGDPDHSVFRP